MDYQKFVEEEDKFEECSACDGTGEYSPKRANSTCPVCGGIGLVTKEKEKNK